jgi:hypothetical protein
MGGQPVCTPACADTGGLLDPVAMLALRDALLASQPWRARSNALRRLATVIYVFVFGRTIIAAVVRPVAFVIRALFGVRGGVVAAVSSVFRVAATRLYSVFLRRKLSCRESDLWRERRRSTRWRAHYNCDYSGASPCRDNLCRRQREKRAWHEVGWGENGSPLRPYSKLREPLGTAVH